MPASDRREKAPSANKTSPGKIVELKVFIENFRVYENYYALHK